MRLAGTEVTNLHKIISFKVLVQNIHNEHTTVLPFHYSTHSKL